MVVEVRLGVWLSAIHTCFSCRKADRETKPCAMSSCGRFYHPSCVLHVETTQLHKHRFHCPLHACATCFADADDDDIDWLRRQAFTGMTAVVKLTHLFNLFPCGITWFTFKGEKDKGQVKVGDKISLWCLSLATFVVPTPVKTILELFRHAFWVLPKTGDAEQTQTWLRTVDDDLRPLNFGMVTARRCTLWIDWNTINSWRRLHLRDMLQRERERGRVSYEDGQDHCRLKVMGNLLSLVYLENGH